MVNIAILGYGTVGSGVVEVLNTNGKSIAKRIGEEINIKYVLDLRDFPGDPIQEKIVHDYNTILNDEEVKIVVEVMGGTTPAFTFAKQALEAGKSVATSNKELVAKHGAELLAIAKERTVNFLFEASVGGGIPIIRPLIQSLTADEIVEITGILNGTTNYMLTKMAQEGVSYDAILRRAQDKGYAERNPAADVEGHDACRKIAILTSLAYGKQVDYEKIYTEGITHITDIDFKYANQLGMSIKLLATGKKVDGKVFAMVAPMMIDSEHPLYGVNGVFNAIFIHGNMLGDAMFYGRGAGKLPTASAVVADIIDEVKHIATSIKMNWSPKKLELADIGMAKHCFFVRVSGEIAAAGEAIKKLFGDVHFVTLSDVPNEFAFMTGRISEELFNEKIGQIDGLITRIRAICQEDR